MVVEGEVAIQDVLYRPHPREEAPMCHSSARMVLGRRSTKALVPAWRGRIRVPDALVLAAVIGQDPLKRPARDAVGGQHPVEQEAGRRPGRALGGDPGHGVRARRIAGGVLPNCAYALELADKSKQYGLGRQTVTLRGPG